MKLDGNAYLFEFKVAERSGSPKPAPLPPESAANGAPRKLSGTGDDPLQDRRDPDDSPQEETAALAQLKARRYADKFRAPDCRVHLIGVEINAEQRDIASFEVEPA